MTEVYATALSQHKHLHRFWIDVLRPADLEEALVCNHSLIAGVGDDKSDIPGLLQYNRVRTVCACVRVRVWSDVILFCGHFLVSDFALELEPCGAGSEFCAIHRSNGVCTALLRAASD